MDPKEVARKLARARVVNVLGKNGGFFRGTLGELAEKAKVPESAVREAVNWLRREPFERKDGSLLTIPHVPRGPGTSVWFLLEVTDPNNPVTAFAAARTHWYATVVTNAQAMRTEMLRAARWFPGTGEALRLAAHAMDLTIERHLAELAPDWTEELAGFYPTVGALMEEETT